MAQAAKDGPKEDAPKEARSPEPVMVSRPRACLLVLLYCLGHPLFKVLRIFNLLYSDDETFTCVVILND